MSTVFYTEASVFFVGGTGTKAGNANCGGCTKEWFDNNFTQLSDIMSDNGAPLIAASGCSFTYSTNQITHSAPVFTNAEAGMVGHASGTNMTTGRYKITKVFSAYTIEVSGIHATDDNTDTVINIGGAFDSLQNALDATSAVSYDCSIYTNKSETLTATVDVDTGGGLVSTNTHKRIVGFSTLPGDMAYGMAYYQSAFDRLKNGLTAGTYVDIDANGGAFDVLNVAGQKNIEFYNLFIHNTNKAVGNFCVSMSGTTSDLTFIGCAFDDADKVIAGGYESIKIIDCFVGDGISRQVINVGDGSLLLNSVTQSTGANPLNLSGVGKAVNSIIVGGTTGCQLYTDANVLLANCVLYNQSDKSIGFANSNARLVIYNTIVMPQMGAEGVHHAGGGSLVYEDYNCFIDTDGNHLTSPILNDYSGGTTSDMGEHSIEVDPAFVDAGGGDFVPRNIQILCNGKPDMAGNPTQIGATLKGVDLPVRSRQVNLGRLGIIR